LTIGSISWKFIRFGLSVCPKHSSGAYPLGCRMAPIERHCKEQHSFLILVTRS